MIGRQADARSLNEIKTTSLVLLHTWVFLTHSSGSNYKEQRSLCTVDNTCAQLVLFIADICFVCDRMAYTEN